MPVTPLCATGLFAAISSFRKRQLREEDVLAFIDFCVVAAFIALYVTRRILLFFFTRQLFLRHAAQKRRHALLFTRRCLRTASALLD